MSKEWQITIGIMFVVAAVSAALVYWRAESFAKPEELVEKGLATYRQQQVTFYGLVMPIAVGLIAFYVFRTLENRSPDSAEQTLLLLAVGIAIVFTIMAAVVFKMRAFYEFAFLHVVYAAGFGWIMPLLFNRAA